jgi:hypothetical protein
MYLESLLDNAKYAACSQLRSFSAEINDSFCSSSLTSAYFSSTGSSSSAWRLMSARRQFAGSRNQNPGRDELAIELVDVVARLSGRKGENLLVGGAGDDRLTGGSDRDVLLGGTGADKLNGGGKSEDLLVAGPTDFENDLTDLSKLMDIVNEWNSASDCNTRVSHLSGAAGGQNGTTFLTSSTMHDGVKDVLSGGLGLDWFFVSALDTVTTKTGEQTVTI